MKPGGTSRPVRGGGSRSRCAAHVAAVGLATALVPLHAQAAAEHGFHIFGAAYLAGNRPVAALVEDADGLGRPVIKQGIAGSRSRSTGKNGWPETPRSPWSASEWRPRS